MCCHVTLHALLVVMWCSLIEQKVDQMAAELTRRQQEREDTALQYKRYACVGIGMTMSAVGSYVILSLCVGHSLLEQKVDQLTEMMADLSKRVQSGEGHGPA